MGFVNLYNKNHEAAIEAAKRSIEIAPNYGDAYGLLALISNWMGRSEDAIQYAMKGMQLNPHYSWDYPYNIGRAHYQLKNHEAAETHLLQALERNPAALPAQMFLIANYARAGNLEEAEWLVTELSISNPEISISQFSENWPFFTDELKEYVVSDLRSAGIPE